MCIHKYNSFSVPAPSIYAEHVLRCGLPSLHRVLQQPRNLCIESRSVRLLAFVALYKIRLTLFTAPGRNYKRNQSKNTYINIKRKPGGLFLPLSWQTAERTRFRQDIRSLPSIASDHQTTRQLCRAIEISIIASTCNMASCVELHKNQSSV